MQSVTPYHLRLPLLLTHCITDKWGSLNKTRAECCLRDFALAVFLPGIIFILTAPWLPPFLQVSASLTTLCKTANPPHLALLFPELGTSYASITQFQRDPKMKWFILDRSLLCFHVSKTEQSKAGNSANFYTWLQGCSSQCHFPASGKEKDRFQGECFIFQQMAWKLHNSLLLISHWPELGHNAYPGVKWRGRNVVPDRWPCYRLKLEMRVLFLKDERENEFYGTIKSFCHALSFCYIYLLSTYFHLTIYGFKCLFFVSPH